MKNLKIQSISILIIILSIVSCSESKKDNTPWVDLFDGKTLNGWNIKGGKATYKVEDGAIVGTSVLNTENTFLCSDKMYGDFILEIEYKVDPKLNSGIQIRSNSIDSYRDGRVHGYQIEIDPAPRAWSAGIFDEARRGWLYPLVDNQTISSSLRVIGGTSPVASVSAEYFSSFNVDIMSPDCLRLLGGR